MTKMTAMQLWLRLPAEIRYTPGRESRTTGSAQYSQRLAARRAWAEEIQIAKMAARLEAPPSRFVARGWRPDARKSQ